jgi:multiple sugar transport system permease protein
VGLANFREMFGEAEFFKYLYNTVFMMLGIPISIAGSLMLALILNQKLRGIVVFRTMFYIPTITSGVALYVMWKALYNPEFGFLNISLYWFIDHLGINGLRHALHLAPVTFEMLPKWHLDVTWAKPSLMLMGIWAGVGGGNMLLYLAGLSNIPVELYEAADLDGAAPLARFRYITWPQLAPTTFFVVIMSVIGGLQGGFDQARTVAWTMFLAILVITLVNWRYGNRFVESAT